MIARQGVIKIPIGSLAKLPGLQRVDRARLEMWASDIVERRLKLAIPEMSTEVIKTTDAVVVNVTDIRARILQVLDEGVLASEFVGRLHKGTQTVRTTQVVTADDPVTNQKISRVVATSSEEVEVTEDVNDDLCYIVGDTSKLVDGEIVTIKSMKLQGRHQYVDLMGRPRTIREYHVDSADAGNSPVNYRTKLPPAADGIDQLLRAANQGNADAQYDLALAYSDGHGVPENINEAVKWYRRAAEQGNTSAEVILGTYYVGGVAHDEGVDDNVMAYMWFSLSASAGVEEGRTSRDSIKPQLTQEQLGKAEQLTRAWKPKKEVVGR